MDYIEKYKYKYLKELLISGDMFMKNEELDYNDAVLFYMKNKDKMRQIEIDYKSQNKKLHNMIRYDVLNYLNDNRSDYCTDDDKGTTPRVYIQFFKKKWNSRGELRVHFELLFNTELILSDKVKCDVVLHIEGKPTNEDMELFAKKGITRRKTLACYNNEPICSSLELSFSSKEAYKESINKMINELEKLLNKYEKILDEIF